MAEEKGGFNLSEKLSFSITVVRHAEIKSSEKEPTYSVSLKTEPTAAIQTRITIKSDSKDVFERFPLDENFTLTFTTPQTRLA